jgi:DNA-binding IclR family transcriptional regulator
MDSTERGNTAATAKSAVRVFEILEAMRTRGRALTASDLAQALGYPLSSAWALLRDLVKLGYLLYDTKTRTYFPAPKLLELGSWLAGPSLVDPALADVAAQLHRRFGEVISLAVVQQTSILLNPIQAPQPQPGASGAVAARAATCRTISGRTWLSLRSDDEIAAVTQAHNATSRRDSHVVPEAVSASVVAIRKAGFGLGASPTFSGYAVYAFPVEDRTHGRVSVMNVSGCGASLLNRKKWIVAAARDALGSRWLRYD